MDIGKIFSHRHRSKSKKGDTARLAAELAPLEERRSNLQHASLQDHPAEFSGIVIENADLHPGRDILESSGAKTFLGMEPVVLVILAVVLAFIAFIAWQISLMPV